MQTRTTTARSVSLDSDLVLWIEEQAAGENRSVSNFVNTLLARVRQRHARSSASAPQSPARAPGATATAARAGRASATVAAATPQPPRRS